MNSEDLQTRKRMFVVALDRSWLATDLLFHRKLIKSDADIETLRRHGILEVTIDTARGVDATADVDAPE
jgi:hypothetical protein